MTLDSKHAWWSLDRQLEMYRFRGLLDLSLEVVPRLAPDLKTGKFKRMVSLVGPPESPPERGDTTRTRFHGPEALLLPILRGRGTAEEATKDNTRPDKGRDAG
jgi:hypothetical protein